LNYEISTVLAWVLAVVFAYLTNKFYVFKSAGLAPSLVLKEAAAFVLARVASGFFDLGWMVLAVKWLHIHDMLAKILSNGVVVAMNYVFSKMFIFKRAS
jgi:putative flippase GtrA